MQQLLAEEAAQPMLLRAVREGRVCYFQPLELMRTGRFDRAVYKIRTSMLGAKGDDLIDRRRARACQAAYLRWSTALVVLTMIRFLAYTLSLVFYHRQVRSHARGKCETFHECAKRIAYWFVAPAANTS